MPSIGCEPGQTVLTPLQCRSPARDAAVQQHRFARAGRQLIQVGLAAPQRPLRSGDAERAAAGALRDRQIDVEPRDDLPHSRLD